MKAAKLLGTLFLLALAAGFLFGDSQTLPDGPMSDRINVIGIKGADGKAHPLSGNNDGTLNVTASSGIASSTRVSSTVLEASRVLRNAAGLLMNVQIYNGGASAQYYLIFDSTTVPANGTAPVVAPVKVSADTTVYVDFGPVGMNFTSGIAVSNSSTAVTKTIGSADSFYSASYR